MIDQILMKSPRINTLAERLTEKTLSWPDQTAPKIVQKEEDGRR